MSHGEGQRRQTKKNRRCRLWGRLTRRKRAGSPTGGCDYGPMVLYRCHAASRRSTRQRAMERGATAAIGPEPNDRLGLAKGLSPLHGECKACIPNRNPPNFYGGSRGRTGECMGLRQALAHRRSPPQPPGVAMPPPTRLYFSEDAPPMHGWHADGTHGRPNESRRPTGGGRTAAHRPWTRRPE